MLAACLQEQYTACRVHRGHHNNHNGYTDCRRSTMVEEVSIMNRETQNKSQSKYCTCARGLELLSLLEMEMLEMLEFLSRISLSDVSLGCIVECEAAKHM